MSPRAAARLETLGFTKVFDYVSGERDWFAAGLPREGDSASIPIAGDAVRGDDVTCRLDERLGDIVKKVSAAGKDACIVVDDRNVVLGRIRGRSLKGEPEATAEQAMKPGPGTIRPDNELAEVVEYYGDTGLKSILVTDQDGKLIGTLYLEDARKLLDRHDDGTQD